MLLFISATFCNYLIVFVIERCVLTLTNVASTEIVQLALHQKNPAVGTRHFYRTASILLEPEDAALIVAGEEVTLMGN